MPFEFLDEIFSAVLCQVSNAKDYRTLVAIAGPPGSGKSFVAEKIAERLNSGQPKFASVVPMDGFHFDNCILEARGLLLRKGSAETFDVCGLFCLLSRVRESSEDEISFPVFDRALELSRASAGIISTSTKVVIVEGNYLLLNHLPWARIHPLFDITAMVRSSEQVLRHRLQQRWEGYGFEKEDIDRKVEENDLVNGRLVVAGSIVPDLHIEN